MQFGVVFTKCLNFSNSLQNQSCAHGINAFNCEDSAFSAIHTPTNMCMVARTHTRFRLHFGVTAELDPIKKPLTRVPCRSLRKSSYPQATLPIISSAFINALAVSPLTSARTPSREQLHHMRFGLSTARGSNAENHAPVDDKTTQVS